MKLRLTAARTAGVPAFVFIMFGHNDQKKVTDTDGPSYLTFASNNQNGTVAGTYYDYLERYIVETRELGGIPILFTPFVRQYLEGSPAASPSPGSTTSWRCTRARPPPAATIRRRRRRSPPNTTSPSSTSRRGARRWSKRTPLRARLPYVYISGDQTHVRNLGALLMAEEAVRALNAQGILTGHRSQRRRG